MAFKVCRLLVALALGAEAANPLCSTITAKQRAVANGLGYHYDTTKATKACALATGCVITAAGDADVTTCMAKNEACSKLTAAEKTAAKTLGYGDGTTVKHGTALCKTAGGQCSVAAGSADLKTCNDANAGYCSSATCGVTGYSNDPAKTGAKCKAATCKVATATDADLTTCCTKNPTCASVATKTLTGYHYDTKKSTAQCTTLKCDVSVSSAADVKTTGCFKANEKCEAINVVELNTALAAGYTYNSGHASELCEAAECSVAAGSADLKTCFTPVAGKCSSLQDTIVPGYKFNTKTTGTACASAACTVAADKATCFTQNTVTTTLTPWDSSASSSGEKTSLDSSYSGSFKHGSSGDSSGSEASSGSTGSGSSGSFLRLWMWELLIALCCLCCAACAAAGAMQKAPKKKKTAPKPAPAPAPEPVEEVPLLTPIMPLTTTAVPSYSMAMPATTAYAAPATMAYTTGYAGYPGTVV